MNIYDYAIKLEKEGEAFYREAATRSAHKGIAAILVMLADGKARHSSVFQRLKRNEPPALAETKLLADAKAVFKQMSSNAFYGLEVSEIETYKTAQDIERKTIDFYLEKAHESEGEPQETILRQVAEEEQRHCFLLSNLIELISRPQNWLENAEWYHLDEY